MFLFLHRLHRLHRSRGHRLHNVRYAGYTRGEIRLRSGHIVSIRSLRSALLYLSNDPEQALDQFCNLSSKGFQRIPKKGFQRKDSKGFHQTTRNIHFCCDAWSYDVGMNGRNCLRSQTTRKRKARVDIFYKHICKQYANMQTIL